MKTHFLQPLLREPERAWRLRNLSSGRLLATTILPAFDRAARNRGLLGRSTFPVDAAMVLAPCSAIHTWLMQFPIDVIFVSRGGQVLRIRQALAPYRLTFRIGAFAAIELAAGATSGTVAVGDLLLVTAATS
jgi:uncharacterized membrane protein (UPF0127 family)